LRRVLTGRKMKLVVAIFCAVALAAGAFVWGMGSSPGSGQIIATVDGTTITRSELQANVDQMKMMYQMQGQEVTPELENQLRQTVLNELISEVLIYHEAEARGVTVPQEDIEEQYEMILAQFDDEEAGPQTTGFVNPVFDVFGGTRRDEDGFGDETPGVLGGRWWF